MNAPFVVAQTTGQAPAGTPVRIVRVSKPESGQAVTLQLSYDQTVKLDLSAISSENITLVHIGEKLIILFDNRSTVTVQPFFDSTGAPLQNLVVEVAPGRDVSGTEFANLFPITTDQSVLPAAGDDSGPRGSAAFSDPSVDPLLGPNPLPLLPPEELPNWVTTVEVHQPLFEEVEAEAPATNGFPTATNSFPAGGPSIGGIDDEGQAFGIPNATAAGDVAGEAVAAHGFLGFTFGGDGAGNITFDAGSLQVKDQNGASTGLLAHVFNATTLAWETLPVGVAGSPDGHTVTGTVIDSSGTTHQVFTLQLIDPATGEFSFTAFASFAHPLTDDPSTPGTETSFEDDLQLSFVFTVTDGNGDSATATLTINVDDDSPEPGVFQGEGSGSFLSEGNLENFNPSFDPTSDNVEGSEGSLASGSNPLQTTGNVSFAFNFGADQPGSFNFASPENLQAWVDGLGINSKGEAVDTVTVSGNVLTASTSGANAHDVFTFELDSITGQWTFTLLDQLDHVEPDSDIATNLSPPISIDFAGAVTGADSDGDAIPLAPDLVVMTIVDDTPQVNCQEQCDCEVVVLTDAQGISEVGGQDCIIIATVQEDDLANFDSVSGFGSDGNNEDGSLNADVASGSLGAIVESGADEQLTYAFTADAVATMDALGLSSQGETISYQVAGNTLTAYVELGVDSDFDAGVDRPVFTFELDGATGDFTFTLLDQLDHDAGNGENFALKDGGSGIESINFGDILQVTDFDGDGVTFDNHVFIAIQDDIPVQNDAAVSGTVEEDDLDNFVIATGFGSDGNNEDGSLNADVASGSLTSLVSVGADEPGTFSLSLDGADLPTVNSQGKPVLYSLTGDTLTGFVDVGAANGTYEAGTDRPVFTLQVEADGDFTFTLLDQLDHEAGNGENGMTLDFSSIVQFTDFDEDTITLSGGFSITVQDDVPLTAEGALASIQVDEDDLAFADGDLSNGNPDADTDEDEATFTDAQLQALVDVGADEPAVFSLDTTISGTVTTADGTIVTSKGGTVLFGVDGSDVVGFVNVGGSGGFDFGVDREVFRLTDNGDGSFTFDLKDQVDHLPLNVAGGDEEILTIDLTGAFDATDFDADPVTLAADSIVVEVENDVPINSGTTIISGTTTVDEDNLTNFVPLTGFGSQGNDDGADGETTIASGVIIGGALPGADEPLTFQLSTDTSSLDALGLESKGDPISYQVVGDTLTAYVELGVSDPGFDLGTDRSVFTLQVTSAGAYTFTLLDQVDHLPNTPANNDEQTIGIDFAPLIQRVDFDGDPIGLSGTFTITIEDDLPTLGDIDSASITNVSSTVTGDFVINDGADEPATPSLLAYDGQNSGLTSGGTDVLYEVDPANPNILIAYLEGGDPADPADQVFKLTVTAGTDSYRFDLFKPLDGTTTTVAIGDSASFGSGPAQQQILQDASNNDLSIISGWNTPGGFNVATWKATGNPGALTIQSVNGSTAGWGVDNNNFDSPNEFMRFDFGDVDDFDGAGPYTTAPVTLPNVSVANFEFSNYSNGDTVDYVIHYQDGSIESGQIAFTSNATLAVQLPPSPSGEFLDYIELYASDGAGKVDLVSVAAVQETVDIDLAFNVVVSDFDTDTVTGTININVTSPPVNDAPYVLAPAQIDAFRSDTTPNFLLNTISFQDEDAGAGNVTVTIAAASAALDGTFTAADGASLGVTETLSAGGATLILDGAVAAINQYLAANNVSFTAVNTSDHTLSVTINDNGNSPSGPLTGTDSIILHSTASSPPGTDLSGWTIDGSAGGTTTFSYGNGGQTVATAWTHLPDAQQTTYDGGGGTDSISIVFTPTQLEAILSDAGARTALQTYLDGEVTGTTLSLGTTAWNANVTNFENATLALASSDSFVGYTAIGENLPDFLAGLTGDANDNTLVGTAAGETMSGNGGNDIVVGLAGNDTLNGNAGADLLLGGTGNDTLAGGTGNDLLSGGTGGDSYVYANGETGAGNLDIIVDYSFVDGDKIDVSALLDANFGPGSDVADFVQLVDSGSNITVQVDINGATGGANFVDVVTLANYGSSNTDIVNVVFEGAEHHMAT
jgi:T1SS-143 domain-containing protein